MKTFFRIAFLLALLSFPSVADAAARFWVSGSGTWDNSATTHWSTTSGGASGSAAPTSSDTVTFDGNSGAGAVITVNANVTAAVVQLGTTGGNFTGTLDFATNNNSPTFGQFAFSGSGTRTLNLGSGTFTLTTANGASPWDITTVAGLTFNGASATIVTAPTTISSGRQLNLGSGLTYGTIVATNPSLNSLSVIINPGTSATVGTITINTGMSFGFANSITVTTLNIVGTSTTSRVLYNAQSGQTITLTTLNADWCILGNFKASGGSFTATNSLDFGGNTNVTISAPPASGGGGHIIGG